ALGRFEQRLRWQLSQQPSVKLSQCDSWTPDSNPYAAGIVADITGQSQLGGELVDKRPETNPLYLTGQRDFNTFADRFKLSDSALINC
ncbi:MAG: hypothetical protein V7752_09280, partial [Halopseudomonas sp.]